MDGKKAYKRRSVEMSLEETFHLISEVQMRRCLWDRTHEDHRCRKTRDESWQDMSLGMNYDADDLLEKWQSLRSSYRQYKSLMRKRARQSVSGRIRVVKWPFYSAMSFTNYSKDEEEMPVLSLPTKIRIEDPNKPLPTKATNAPKPTSVPKPISVPKLQSSKAPPASTPNLWVQVAKSTAMAKNPVKTPIKPPREPIQTEPEFLEVEVDSLLNTPSSDARLETTDCLQNPQDEDVMYGQSIALQMKQFSPRTKRKLQIHIHDLIAEAQKESFVKEFGQSYDG